MSKIHSFPLSEKDRKETQHKLKVFTEQCFKRMVGKGIDVVQVNIFEDLVVVRGSGLLSTAELNIATQSSEYELKIKNIRISLADEYTRNLEEFLTELLDVKILGRYYDMSASKDFAICALVLDRVVT